MKNVYFFSKGQSDGNAAMKELLGGKGANLAEMAELGIPVPPGFTITTHVCAHYQEHGGVYPKGLEEEVAEHLKKLEQATGKRFGDAENPLLVSVRSGAAASMPGMMDTILNLGLTDKTVEGLTAKSGNRRFAYDSYRRLIQMYGDVVMGLKPETEADLDPFEVILDEVKKESKAKLDTDLDADALKGLVERFQAAIETRVGRPFPQDPKEQLWGAIEAVFRSWNNPRAIKYRELYDIRGLLGTAVNVQSMVFGNMGEGCGTGVAFTRNPATGENAFYGEYLMNAQGEDVVAGIRTPQPISTLEKEMPQNYKELLAIRTKLEQHYRDMQDIEFTIESGHLYMLQTRNGKRTAAAAVRIAVEMAEDGMIDRKEALRRVTPEQIDQLLHPTFAPRDEAKAVQLTRGLPASPGAATGSVVFSAEAAEAAAAAGKRVVLVRIETSAEDIGGMNAAQGILTARGGMTSHAAVVARGMGKCCVAGAGDLSIHYAKGYFTVGGKTVRAGDPISLNGTTGAVYKGEISTQDPELAGHFGTLLGWADEVRKLGIRTNADTPHDAIVAVKFGAEGIGLCRTEHMFFEGDRIIAVREMILAENEAGRRAALEKLLPMQRGDFEGIYKALDGRAATIRLLDPPLHEFLPHDVAGQEEVAEVMRVSVSVIREKVESLHEFNPMLGHRGCRLGITFPEISEMQARAIMEAACNVHKKGTKVRPEIMIPLVGHVRELKLQRDLVERTAEEVLKENGLTKKEIPYLIGTMIEVPRAAVTADEIAQEAEFFSFGTNDLTQMGCGFSRDDSGRFLKDYVALGIYEKDPFQVLDRDGVGKLVAMACELGKKTRPSIKLGICGEHGGDPASIHFCHRVGLNYVSCSPYRVPIARLAAAQAAILDKA
ncbi:MAG: pyruvate, phosphate dikinase [Candidatus Bipolaricaulis sp.]|nr:pyruvate, phosphate dikinase [Candidatus Bipolaricaulis sp.]MDD5646462.1 pyruvate, phosphate dikinase [Candidatus Bipolaricaulis sp.]